MEGPRRSKEHPEVCAILMMISGLVWAYIVGGLTHATGRLHVLRIRGLADSDHGSIRNSKSRRGAQVPEVEFKREMDELNNLMDSSGLPQDLRAACRSASLESFFTRSR